MLIFSSGVNRKVMADAISTASYFQPFKKYTIPRKERRPSEGKPDSMPVQSCWRLPRLEVLLCGVNRYVLVHFTRNLLFYCECCYLILVSEEKPVFRNNNGPRFVDKRCFFV